MNQNCKKQVRLRIDKVTKRKGNKVYVKWKGYASPFNRLIDKKYIV